MGKGGAGDQKTSGALPWWVRGAHQNLINEAGKFVFQGRGDYQPYPDPRIADLTSRETSANAAREGLFRAGDRYSGIAAGQYGLGSNLIPGIVSASASEFTPEEYNRRRNPYYEGVIQTQLREADRSFNRRLHQNEADSVARGGSIGSYRVNLENAFLEGERAETLGDIRRRGELDAYDQALGQFQQDRDAKMRGLGSAMSAYRDLGSAYDTLGGNVQTREISRINELDRAGAIERELRQRELDLGYSDFVEERDFPMNRLRFMSEILTGVPNAQLATQRTRTAQPGLISQLTGLGLGAAAISRLLQPGE